MVVIESMTVRFTSIFCFIEKVDMGKGSLKVGVGKGSLKERTH